MAIASITAALEQIKTFQHTHISIELVVSTWKKQIKSEAKKVVILLWFKADAFLPAANKLIKAVDKKVLVKEKHLEAFAKPASYQFVVDVTDAKDLVDLARKNPSLPIGAIFKDPCESLKNDTSAVALTFLVDLPNGKAAMGNLCYSYKSVGSTPVPCAEIYRSHLNQATALLMEQGLNEPTALDRIVHLTHEMIGTAESLDDFKASLQRCFQCDKRPEGDAKFLRCGCCKYTHYCSSVCQKVHWPQHKPLCKLQTILMRYVYETKDIFYNTSARTLLDSSITSLSATSSKGKLPLPEA